MRSWGALDLDDAERADALNLIRQTEFGFLTVPDAAFQRQVRRASESRETITRARVRGSATLRAISSPAWLSSPACGAPEPLAAEVGTETSQGKSPFGRVARRQHVQQVAEELREGARRSPSESMSGYR